MHRKMKGPGPGDESPHIRSKVCQVLTIGPWAHHRTLTLTSERLKTLTLHVSGRISQFAVQPARLAVCVCGGGVCMWCEDVGSPSIHVRMAGTARRTYSRCTRAFRHVPRVGVQAQMLQGPGQGISGPVGAVEP